MIGGGTALGERLAWFDLRPLSGRRILVTRPAHQADALAALLRAQGAEPVLAPAIELVDADPAPIRAAISRLRSGGYDDVVFTSVNGVERFAAHLRAAGGDARSFGKARLTAIGPATSAALERFGLRTDLTPPAYTSAGLLEALRAPTPKPPAKRRVLLARAAQGSPVLSDGLRASGASVDDLALYDVRTAPADPTALEQLRAGRIDTVTFTSTSTVRGLLEQAGAAATTDVLADVEIAVIGPVAGDAARAAGLTVHIEAAVHTMEGLVDAIVSARQRQDAPQ